MRKREELAHCDIEDKNEEKSGSFAMLRMTEGLVGDSR
jgi:hypothetical protein